MVTQDILDNLDKDILKESKEILQELQKDSLNEFAEQASQIAEEVSKDVANDPQTKSMWDEKVYGSFTLKQLVGAHYQGHIDLGIGR